MSGTLPIARYPGKLTVTSLSPTLSSRAQSLKGQKRSRGGQRWTFRFEYDPMEPDLYMDLWGFLNAQRGQYDTFTLIVPADMSPRGTWSGAPAVAANVAAGVSAVPIDGLDHSVQRICKRGDFVKFGTALKVYQLTADAHSDGSGATTLAIMPALMEALTDNESITVHNVPFTVSLTSDESQVAVQGATLATLAFEAMEEV